MPTMNVSLTDDLSSFVSEQLAEGYNNVSEVIRDGLLLLRARNQKLRDLRQAVALGAASANSGPAAVLTDDVLRDIADRGSRRAEARQTGHA